MEVTFPAKSCSGAKLHRCIIIARVGYVNRDGNRMFTWALFVYDSSLCELQADLLSHLHSWLQINGSLHTYQNLDVTLQTVKKTKQGFSLLYIYTLRIMLKKANDVIRNWPSLGPFRQYLPSFEGIVSRHEVVQQRCLQIDSTRHITLHLKPDVGLALQQPNRNLTWLYIVS